MNRKPLNTRLILRYIYALLAIVAVAATVVIVSLYTEQRSEREIRNRIQFFHLESVAESQELAREARTLLDILRDEIDPEKSDNSGAPGVRSMQIGYGGLLISMRTRLQHLSTLQEQNEGEVFARALRRMHDRFDKIDRRLRDSDLSPKIITSVEVFRVSIEQYDRLHKIAGDTELRGLADRHGGRPRFLAVLAVCLGFTALVGWYLIASLRASLVRQESAERALVESQKRLNHIQKMDALGRLTGGIAHDFNNLLMVILGHTELLQDKVKGDERLETGLNEIRLAGSQAASLTQQLLAFSRRQNLKPQKLDLNALIRGMEEMLRRIIGADVELTCSYADDLFAVELDPDQLQQVIMNLIGNARDAMPDGGALSISTGNISVTTEREDADALPVGEYARLTVADSGVGIDEQARERLFEPFYTTKEEGRGTGLGLSTVHGIVTASNGHIVVDSERGAGSRFHVYFPRAQGQPGTTPQIPGQPAPQKGSETVLIVEDDENVRQLVEKGLSSLGYRTLTASSGAAGLEICRSKSVPIDVIVSDVVMSGMSGPQFMANALKNQPAAVAIYVSAYTRDAVLQFRRSDSEREIPLITKPFTLESLSRVIRDSLDKNVISDSSSQ